MSSRTASILRAARALIEKPELWCTGVFALDADGREIMPESPHAIRHCMTGAIRRGRAALGAGWEDEELAYLAAQRGIGASWGTPLCSWNDDPARTHAEVLAAFDAAIEAEEAHDE